MEENAMAIIQHLPLDIYYSEEKCLEAATKMITKLESLYATTYSTDQLQIVFDICPGEINEYYISILKRSGNVIYISDTKDIRIIHCDVLYFVKSYVKQQLSTIGRKWTDADLAHLYNHGNLFFRFIEKEIALLNLFLLSPANITHFKYHALP